MTELAILNLNTSFLTNHPNRNTRHRQSKFVGWLNTTGQLWTKADLGDYSRYLINDCGLSAKSVEAHLATVRSRYKDILASNWLLDALDSQIDANLGPADRKAMIDWILLRINNNINPRNVKLDIVEVQDRADSEHIRLTPEQANELLDSPERFWGDTHLAGLRDSAVIAVLLCTGIREGELCSLMVGDLYEHLGGVPALRVSRGKGAKQRLIPYGELDWCLAFVEDWLKAAQIGDGYVFRGFTKNYRSVRQTRIDESSIQDIVGRYPMNINGELATITVHDLRRTYARNLYNSGMSLEAIQKNLGHKDLKTTLLYIGELDASVRSPKNVYDKSK